MSRYARVIGRDLLCSSHWLRCGRAVLPKICTDCDHTHAIPWDAPRAPFLLLASIFAAGEIPRECFIFREVTTKSFFPNGHFTSLKMISRAKADPVHHADGFNNSVCVRLGTRAGPLLKLRTRPGLPKSKTDFTAFRVVLRRTRNSSSQIKRVQMFSDRVLNPQASLTSDQWRICGAR